MIYSYGARLDNDSNAITVIDEENKTAVTTGYVNGEYVEFSGGGGSSDFSTAEVTLNISGEFSEFSRESCSFVDTNNNLISGSLWTDSSTTKFIVPLYKGKCYWVSSFLGATLTGGIESYEDGLLITGNGTISITIS